MKTTAYRPNPFSISHSKKKWAAHRMKVLAENISNVSVAKYKSRDIKTFSLRKNDSVIKRTDPRHLLGTKGTKLRQSEFSVKNGFENINQNSVQIPDELQKLNKTGEEYNAAIKIQETIKRWFEQVIK